VAERLRFDAAVSIEVSEHRYSQSQWTAAAHASLLPGVLLIFSTSYHEYLNNNAQALIGEINDHFTALLQGGISSSGAAAS
jgi:hypothetical protein